MIVEIATPAHERAVRRYLGLRDASLNAMVYGVHPNLHDAITKYNALLEALAGDLSDMAAYHENAVAAVSPFVAAMQASMRATNDTMHIVNVLATATGQDTPFAIPPETITVQDYLDTLQDTIDTLTATMQATQQAAQALGGG